MIPAPNIEPEDRTAQKHGFCPSRLFLWQNALHLPYRLIVKGLVNMPYKTPQQMQIEILLDQVNTTERELLRTLKALEVADTVIDEQCRNIRSNDATIEALTDAVHCLWYYYLGQGEVQEHVAEFVMEFLFENRDKICSEVPFK